MEQNKKVYTCYKEHFIAGLVVGFLSYPFIGLYSFLFVFTLAIGKEIYDYFDDEDRTDVDILDAVFTIEGGTFSIYIMFWIWRVIGW